MDCELEKRLADIETRLTNIELSLKISPPVFATPQKPKPTTTTPHDIIPRPSIVKPGNWLGLTAIICFVLAAGFIVKLSIDSGWLTPFRQIGIATLFGLVLITTGFALLSSDRAYASLLPATGIIVLYLTVFAARQYYFLITLPSAVILTALISLFCITLYIRIRHDAYAVIAAIGAYLTPVLLDLNILAIFSLDYFLLCSLAFATISIWVRSRLFIIIAAYLAIFVTGFTGFDLHLPNLVAIVLLLHFLIFSIATFLYTFITKQQLSESEAWGFFPVLLLFYALEYYFIDLIYPGLAPWISLAFAAFLLGLYFGAKKLMTNSELHSQTMLLSFTTLVFFHSFYLELLPYDARPWLFIFFILIFTFFPRVTVLKKTSAFVVPCIAMFIILSVEYASMVFHLIIDFKQSWLIVAIAAFASIWLLLIHRAADFMKHTESDYILLSAAHLLAVTALYQLTTDYGSLAVSASWLFYALCVISIAVVRRDKIMATSALFVLSFAAGKALLYDAASAPTIVRILCLLLTGAVLYSTGLLFRRIADWSRNKK